MTIIPGLTSTKKDRIPAFIEDMKRLKICCIALFPTCLNPDERVLLYQELERSSDLIIPHVHLRSDATEAELAYLQDRFKTEVFNIHPRASSHPFINVPASFSKKIFVENSDLIPEPEELQFLGGLCPDYAHWENDRLHDRPEDGMMKEIAFQFPIGCCHISTIRISEPNSWSGEWDHHDMKNLSDFSYLLRYRQFMPQRWASLELENPLEEQLRARDYLTNILLELAPHAR